MHDDCTLSSDINVSESYLNSPLSSQLILFALFWFFIGKNVVAAPQVFVFASLGLFFFVCGAYVHRTIMAVRVLDCHLFERLDVVAEECGWGRGR